MEDRKIYYIRDMRDEDISQVLDIDLDAFPTQWPHPTFTSYHHELRNKLAHYIVICRDNDPQQPAEEKPPAKDSPRVLSFIRGLVNHGRFFGLGRPSQPREYLAGMAGIWMMVDEAHIVTIAVKRLHKNQGLGEWLLISVIELAMRLNARVVTLEVRVSNTIAQKLYEKYGLSKAGTRKKYYSDNGEDALIMTTGDLTSPEYKLRLQQLSQAHHERWNYCYTGT
ncbi:MAG: ribosomal protein S18-alanine N-acetyltransferase [Dehalococcoidia bacterium]|jgi:ribosomal-protein-alanine N-acetyltransferase